MMRLGFFILLMAILSACLQEDLVENADLEADLSVADVSSVQLNVGSQVVLSLNGSANLMLTVFMSDGSSSSEVAQNFNGQTVKWFSNNSKVATVSDSGRLVAVGEGVTTVKATLGIQSAQVTVSITPQLSTLTHIDFHQGTLGVSTRDSFPVTLDATFSDGSTQTDLSPESLRPLLDCDLNLSSSQSSVAVITQDGIVTPVSDGITTFKVQCGGHAGTLTLTVSGLEPSTEEEVGEEVLESIVLSGDASEGEEGESRTLAADLHFNTGDVEAVSDSFVTPAGSLAVLLWSSDSASVTINYGVATFASYGSATVTAFFDGLSASQTLNVKMADEEPTNTDDYFLNSNDVIPDPTYGTNGGYADYLFPEIIYGMPRTGGTHVVSFGGGGFLSIQLNDYVIVDGLGPDFTIFENPINSDYYGYFAERAQISVSDDGINYYSFPCDVNDPEQIYVGCAGVHPVDASVNPLDPSISGGDQFDLADVGLSRAKYILIQDLNTCTSSDPTYYAADGSILCAASGQQGFDLDAMAILNGMNE